MKIHRSGIRGRRLVVELLLVVGLIPLAVYQWTAPQRAERALSRASLADLQEAAKRRPNDARTFYYLGLRQEQAGDIAAAFEAVSHAAELDGDDEDICLKVSSLTSRLYGDQGAFDLLGIFLKYHPNSARVHLAKAELYRKNQSHKRAKEEALAAVKSDSHLAAAWYLVGLSANSLGSTSEAEAALRRAVQEAPKQWLYLMMLGDVLAQEKRPQEALNYARQAVRLAPNEGVTYLSLGKLLLEQAASPADLETARQDLQRSAALQPEIPLTSLLIGRSYVRQARWREAREAMEQAARLAPADPDPVFELVRICRRLGDIAAADRYVQRHRRLRQFAVQKQTLKEKIVTFKDQAPELRLQLARLSTANEDTAEAVEQYRHYLQVKPNDGAAKQELARLENRPANAATAAQTLVTAGTAGPMNNGAPAALLQQADTLYAQKRYPEAEQAYIGVLKRNKQSALACQGLGLTLQAEGKSDQALVFFISAVKLNPDLTPSQFALSQAYMAIDASAEARRRMMQVVAREPGNAAYWHLLGMACSGAEPYYAQAEDALRHAVLLEPRNSLYLLDLADLLAEANKPADAEAIYRQALAPAPEDADASARAGMFFARAQPTPEHRKEAETLLQKAIRQSPNDSYILYALGQLSLDQGDGKQAVAYLRRAIANSTQRDTAELWYLLARAYRRAGDPSEAEKAQAMSRRLREEYQTVRHTEETIDQNPKNVGLRLTLARLYAKRGEYAKAIDTYQTYLQRAPKDAKARVELAALEKQLKASGKLPPMTSYRALIAAAGH